MRRLLLSALLLLAAGAQAAGPAPGAYESHGGWGTLTVHPDGRFGIEALGANAHSCSVEGKLHGESGISQPDPPEEPCRLRLAARGDAVKVEILGGEATCSLFCGARASFDGTYYRPAAGCRPARRQARRDAFLRQYRARQYAAAEATLEALLKDCGDFLFWIELDEVRNDLAIAQHHLGRDADCVATLRPTRAFEAGDARKLREMLPPVDFDSYLPVAQAAWNNLRHCGSPASR